MDKFTDLAIESYIEIGQGSGFPNVTISRADLARLALEVRDNRRALKTWSLDGKGPDNV